MHEANKNHKSLKLVLISSFSKSLMKYTYEILNQEQIIFEEV